MVTIEILITPKYQGGVKCTVNIDGVDYIMENEEVIRVLTKSLIERGYEEHITNRQKYPRITIDD